MRLPFSCLGCRVYLQSRETFRLCENVAEFSPHFLPWTPLQMAVRDELNLHMQHIHFAVCASWSYWHTGHVTNNGISSLSPATTSCKGHIFRFLRILNTSGPIPPQHQAPKRDCRPLWRFVSPSQAFLSTHQYTQKALGIGCSSCVPRKDFPNQLLEWRNYPCFCLPAEYDPAGPSLKIKAFLASFSKVWSLGIMAENFLSASLHLYAV